MCVRYTTFFLYFHSTECPNEILNPFILKTKSFLILLLRGRKYKFQPPNVTPVGVIATSSRILNFKLGYVTHQIEVIYFCNFFNFCTLTNLQKKIPISIQNVETNEKQVFLRNCSTFIHYCLEVGPQSKKPYDERYFC